MPSNKLEKLLHLVGWLVDSVEACLLICWLLEVESDYVHQDEYV